MIKRRSFSTFACSLALLTASASLAVSAYAAPAGFEEGVAALQAGQADEAVARFETLANAGTVDANVSYDRGLAYAARLVREPKPGDFGQAIAAFEEAAALDTRGVIRERADHAADAVRGELAKRRHRDGAKAAFEPTPSLTDHVIALLPETLWFSLATCFALVAAVGALLRRERGNLRWILQLGVVLAVPCLAAAYTSKIRQERERRAVIVVESARLLDEDTRRPLADHEPLVEGALLRVEPTGSSDLRVHAAGVHGILPRTSVRLLAR